MKTYAARNFTGTRQRRAVYVPPGVVAALVADHEAGRLDLGAEWPLTAQTALLRRFRFRFDLAAVPLILAAARRKAGLG